MIKSMSIGEKAIILYMIATYFPQFCFHVLDPYPLVDRFQFESGDWPLAVFALFFLALVLFLHRRLPIVTFPRAGISRLASRVFESRLNALLGFAVIGLATNFLLSEGLSFRESGPSLGEAGLGAAFMMFLKPYIYAWLLYQLLLAAGGATRRRHWARLQATLFLTALLLSVTGAFDLFPIAWNALFVFLGPRKIRFLFLRSRSATNIVLRTLLVVFAIPLALGLVAAMIAIGYIDKMAVGGFTRVIEQIGVGQIVANTMVRASTSYASMIVFAANNLTNDALYHQIASIPIENVPYRLSLISGSPLPRPEITQVSRLNYINYDREDTVERAGASPGLVASAFYAGPFPVGFLIMAAFAVAVIRTINKPFAAIGFESRLTVGSILLCALFSYPLFEDPVDYLLIIDPAELQLIGTFLAFTAASLVIGERRDHAVGVRVSSRPSFGALGPQRSGSRLPSAN